MQKPKKSISISMMLFGVCWCLASGSIYVYNYIFILHAIETTGIVIGHKEHKKKDSTETFSTVYSYIDKNGEQHIKIGSSASYPPEYTIGTQIKVFYDSTNYDNALYESNTVRILCLVFGIGGGLIFCAGFILYRASLKTRLDF